MRLFCLLLLVWNIVLGTPTRAQRTDDNFVDRVAGRTFVGAVHGDAEKYHVSWRFERAGDKVLHKWMAGGHSITYVIEPDGTVSSPTEAAGTRYTFYPNGFLRVSADPRYADAVLLSADGDLRSIARGKNRGENYTNLIYADMANGDAHTRAIAGVVGRAARSGTVFHTSKALFDRYFSNPEGEMGERPIAVLATPPRPATIATVEPVAPAPMGATGPRVALVVANARYAPVLGALPNPANDGRLVAGALRAAGFQVEVVTDADQRTMKQAIARLGQRLGAAGRGATGLFYYAGHGVQSKGVNYLMPVNAEPRVEADVDLDGVAADTVLRQLEDAGAATSIVILDACRDMPLAKASRSAARGLARMDAPGNSYLVYSTAPGQTAADGDGANSPFATALAAEMGKPNQPIEMVFRNVRRAVLAATANRQTPWVTESLSESFVFTPR